MLKRAAAALTLSLLAASLAGAQSVPQDQGACFAMSSNLRASAGALSDDKTKQLEELTKKLESLCDAGKFTEAAAVAKQANALIGK